MSPTSPSILRSVPLALGIATALVAALGSAAPGRASIAPATPAAALPDLGDAIGDLDEECIPSEEDDCAKKEAKKLYKTRKECDPKAVPSVGASCPAAVDSECYVEADIGICQLYTCDAVDDGDVVLQCEGDLTEAGCKATRKSCRTHDGS